MRKLLGPKREKVTRDWRKMHDGSSVICTPLQILSVWSRGRWDLEGMWHKCRRREMHTEFWLWNLKQRDHSENVGIDNIKMDLEETGQTGFTWPRMGQVANSCEHCYCNFGFHKMHKFLNCLSEPQHLSLRMKVCSLAYHILYSSQF